jgi:O-antigen/teichoic acid export membrane protein
MVGLLTQSNTAELIAIYHQSAQLITVLTAPVVLLFFFFSGGVVFLWSGKPDLAANTAPILSVLVLGAFLNGLMQIPMQFQLVHGWTRLAIHTNIVAVTIIVPAIFLVVPYYGAVGAAWVWVILNAGYVLISMQFMHQRLIPNEKIRWYFNDVILPTAGSSVIVLLSKQFQPDNFQNRWHWLVFLLITGFMALLTSLLLANRTRSRVFTILKI